MSSRLVPQFVAEWNRRLWIIAVPMVLANITTPLLGLADTTVIGHLPDPIYLGAVSVGSTIFSLFFWGFGFLRMGTTGITAQAYGASNKTLVRSVLVWAMIISIIAGTLLIALRPLFAYLVCEQRHLCIAVLIFLNIPICILKRYWIFEIIYSILQFFPPSLKYPKHLPRIT